MWSTASLRSPGFPVDALDGLAADEALPALDAMLAVEEALREIASRVKQYCWEESFSAPDTERKQLRRAGRHLFKLRVPEPIPGRPDANELFASVAECRTKLEIARETSHAALAAANGRISEALIQKAGDPRFLEALVWQNRSAFMDMRDRLTAPAPAQRNRSWRVMEQILVSYMQRFSMKNESIGFFGPIGWAQFQADETGIVMTPGPELIADSKVHFEYWTIDALAQALSKNPKMLPWLAPRIHPQSVKIDQIVRAPTGKRYQLKPAQLAVYLACDETALAAEIASKLIKTHPNLFPTREAVFAALQSLVSIKAVLWDLQVPVAPHPERDLRTKISRIGDRDLRNRELAKLDDLELILATVRTAVGDVSKLNERMAALETHFEKLTDAQPTRLAGKTYVGRTVTYLDCRRDVELQFGSELRAQLAPPLTLILESVRWYTHAITQHVHELAANIYQQLAPGNDPQPLPLREFLLELGPAIKSSEPVNHVSARLIAKWRNILEFEEDARFVQFEAAQLRDIVHREFAAPGPGMQTARLHAPDIMIAAPGIEAIRRGDYRFVLGEMHVGTNTLLQTPFVDQHPNPSALFEADRRDLGQPRATAVINRDHVGQRVAPINLTPNGIHIGIKDTPSWRPKEQVIPFSDLFVVKSGEHLEVRTSDGRHAIQLFDLTKTSYYDLFSSGFKLIKAAPHTPRIAIDRLVISRETWRPSAEDLVFTRERSEEARFVGARRWQRGGRLPRHVFIKIASERKPFYMDFDSPISVERMSRYVRDLHRKDPTAMVTISEMLPSPDETWLEDADGRRYCCELRMVAVDPLDAPNWPLS